MESYLRKMVEDLRSGASCPVEDLKDIRMNVPASVINKAWCGVVFGLFLEKGDTAYAREGYFHAVELIGKHLVD